MEINRLSENEKRIVWVLISVIGFSICYLYGPLSIAFIEYKIFNFNLLTSIGFKLFDNLLSAFVMFTPVALVQGILLSGNENRLRFWLLPTFLGSFLGYYISPYIYNLLYSTLFTHFTPLVFTFTSAYYCLPDLILVESAEVHISLIISLILGLISGSVFGLSLGSAQHLFNHKLRLFKLNWIFRITLLFEIIGMVNSILLTYLMILEPNLNILMPLDWDRMVDPHMIIFGAITGVIYGLGTKAILGRAVVEESQLRPA